MPRVRCTGCNHGKTWKLPTGQRRRASCRKTFRTSRDRFRAAKPHLTDLCRMFSLGVPAYRLRHQYEGKLTLTAIERTYRVFRELAYISCLEELVPLSGTLGLDEALFGGKRPGKRGWGGAGKVAVSGTYKRNGRVLTFPVTGRKAVTLLPLVEAHATPGSLYFTDDYHGYASLEQQGERVVVTKDRPVGRDRVNGIEGFWSFAKHWLYMYRGIRREYFHLFLKECKWRHNNRDRDLVPLLELLLRRYR